MTMVHGVVQAKRHESIVPLGGIGEQGHSVQVREAAEIKCGGFHDRFRMSVKLPNIQNL